ncbi:MAG: hypothetical protein ACM3NH_03450 [Candidatus Saccharibacteria bacterium]
MKLDPRKFIPVIILIALFAVPFLAAAQAPCSQGYSGTTLCTALGGTTDYKGLLQKIFTFIAETIGLAAIAMMVYSGARMITANGNPDTIKTAKSGFTWAITGFVIAVLAYVIVVAIENFIGVTNIDETRRALQNPLGNENLMSFAGTILNGFGAIVGILAVLMIIINGFRYVTSGGNEDAATQAKSGILWSVVGLVGVALAYVIIKAIGSLLGS